MSFTFNGVSSDTMKLNITERSVYNAPAYDVQSYDVPGRNGDILIPQNRYKNKTVTYTGFIREKDFPGTSKWARLSAGEVALKGWLCAGAGEYHDLADDYDPGFTRKAYISGETAIDVINDRPEGATVRVTFNCQPFMYYPDTAVTVFTTGNVENTYAFSSLPRIEIVMTSGGTLTVGSKTWTIGDYSGTLICDSEQKDWYDSNQLQNSLVTGSGWPELLPGHNAVVMTGGISRVKIYQRWRTL